MIDKTTSLENALRTIRDGDTIMVGGFGVPGTPFTLIDGLLELGVSNLTLIKNEANEDGMGLSKLIEANRVQKLITSHLGLNATAIGMIVCLNHIALVCNDNAFCRINGAVCLLATQR